MPSHDAFADFQNFGGSINRFGVDPFTDFRKREEPFTEVAPTSLLDPAFATLLEELPEIPYQGALQRADLTPNQRDFFRNRRQELFDQFQGVLDQQVRSGEVPSARFGDFIGNFDFGREFQQRAPSSAFARTTSSPFAVRQR